MILEHLLIKKINFENMFYRDCHNMIETIYDIYIYIYIYIYI